MSDYRNDETARWDAQQVRRDAGRRTEQQTPHRRRRRRRRFSGVQYTLFILVVSAILAGIGWLLLNDLCAFNKKAVTATVEITSEDDIGSVAAKLKDDGLIEYKWFFRLFASFAHAQDKIGIGTYELNTDMGTEKAQGIYLGIERYLQEHGVELLFGYECSNLILENDACRGVRASDGKTELEIFAEHTVVATGRRGADWLEKLCAEHNIAHAPGTVDIGVRVEVRNEIMETVNRVLYESKLVGYPRPFKNKVRTFCQNPGGFVSQENYDNSLAVVNGHSYKDLKTDNTNLAILCSHNFSVPFNQPIAYAQKVGELTNMLGAGHILVQRFGDILDGKRTWEKELAQSNIRPTLPDAVAGDITAAMARVNL